MSIEERLLAFSKTYKCSKIDNVKKLWAGNHDLDGTVCPVDSGGIPAVLNIIVRGDGVVENACENAKALLKDDYDNGVQGWIDANKRQFTRLSRQAWESRQTYNKRSGYRTPFISTSTILEKKETFDETIFLATVILLRPLAIIMTAIDHQNGAIVSWTSRAREIPVVYEEVEREAVVV